MSSSTMQVYFALFWPIPTTPACRCQLVPDSDYLAAIHDTLPAQSFGCCLRGCSVLQACLGPLQGPQKRKFCLASYPDASCLGPGLPPSCYMCLYFHGLALSYQLRMLALPPKSGIVHALCPTYFIQGQLYGAKYACHCLSDPCL